MDERLQERIDEYILGRMSDEDKATFEEELVKDSGLREQYNYTKIVKETVCEHAKLQKLMNDFDEVIKEEPHEKPRVACSAMPAGRVVHYNGMPRSEEVAAKPHRRTWLWVVGVAAMLVVGIFAVKPFFESEVGDIPDFKENETVPIFRGSPNMSAARGGNDLVEINQMIARKQYSKALSMIEEAELEMDEVSYQDRTYKKFENYGEEENEQVEYEKRELQQRKDDLAWMKANALIGLGRKDEALNILDNLRKGDGEYKVKAENLYRKVKK